MVSIRRPVPKHSKKSSLLNIRNVVVLLLVLQGVRLLFRSSPSSPSSEKAPQPHSFQDVLQSGKTHLKKDLKDLQNELESELKGFQHKLPKLPLMGEGDGEEGRDEDADPYTDVDDAQAQEGQQKKRQEEPVDADADAEPDADADHAASGDHESHAPPEPPLHDDDTTKQQKQQQQQLVEPAAIQDQDLDSDSLLVLKKHGTGPTRVGFVQDFFNERSHAAFRSLPLPEMTTLQTKVSQLLQNGSSTVSAQGGPAAAAAAAAARVETKVKACQSYVRVEQPSSPIDTSSTARWLLQENDHCRAHADSDAVLIAYNGADFSRTLCGQVLEPHSAVHVHDDDDNGEHCNEPSYVLPSHDVDPPVNGQGGMPPIVVFHSKPPSGAAPTDTVDTTNLSLEAIPCDIPCEFEKDMPEKGGMLYVQGTPWSLIYTDADPYFNNKAKMERLAFQKDIYYATTSLKSSVPLSFYNFDDYDLRKAPALDWNVAGNAATNVLDSNCMMGGAGSRRHKWEGAMDVTMKVESYGSCQHNADLRPGESVSTMEGRIALMKKNRIALAFEAGTDKDHMTSITWEALMSGAVLAYLGPSNGHEILPSPRAAVYASGFNNWDKFAAYVKNVAESKELWESYQTWRSDEHALAGFERRFNFTRTSPQCRICRWAYAKRYGLGWNHEQQIVTETHVPRTFCLQKEEPQLVTKPFREVWMQRGTDNGSGAAEGNDGSSCTTSTTSLPVSRATVELDHYQVERSVLHHDGITDFDIHKITMGTSQKEDVILRLEFSPHVRNSDGAYFRNTHTLVPNLSQSPLVSSASIQDENAKITILANWVTTITSPQEGMMEIAIQRANENEEDYDDQAANGHRRRIRVIIEDFHPLHDKLTEYFPSHFCKIMTQDFVDPVLLFYPDT